MTSATQSQVTQTIDDHGKTIDDLHNKLAATPGVDKGKLQKAVDDYKKAHDKFRDDALGCMN